jgi:3-hydroxyisobutyrate dehydrogenase-like beta-hydroxyacid dehydrogenase
MTRTGVIGVGLMGQGIGENLLKKGHGLTVVAHRNRAPVEALTALGAREAATSREVAEASDVIVVCVTASPQFRAVADGADGFMAVMGPGKTVIDCTTGEPGVVMDYAERIAAAGGQFADAPLARSPVEARAGKLNAMVGATPETFADIRPILETFCENIFHIGAPGSGAKLKLINNLITMGQAALIAEAVAVCRTTGIDVAKLYEVISKGGGNSGIFQMIMTSFLETGALDGLKFSLANAEKDLRYYSRMTGEHGMAAPMGPAVHNQLMTARKLGFDDGLVGHLVAAALKLNGLDATDKPADAAPGLAKT